jgi:hypothetical protein
MTAGEFVLDVFSLWTGYTFEQIKLRLSRQMKRWLGEPTPYMPCLLSEVDLAGRPVWQNGDVDELDEFGEARQKYKALCYKDVCFWGVAIACELYKTIGNIDVCTGSELLEVKVLIVFLGTAGFSLRGDGR